ncbi:hypothetical protein HYH02_004760 [Chlamydomonas schloesseri]|uniref:Cell division cycle protein 123 n=1 Tax=Chlamydomonas schloesseri TaxID=2026947 RepID=A0A836B833_9CHLO|nr:hypothetical protein HYH02_004760 [Chlamydomonas schloesseri]|eukprot:KAG2450248.1 hypothetical protein HYH02_004760 [Chlamydomonas schloesseri]
MVSEAPQNPLVATQAHIWYTQHEPYALKAAVVPLPLAFLSYLQEDGLFVDEDNAGVRALDNIDARLVVEGEYRRDYWDEPPAGAPGGAAPQPSPSGPLNAARGGVLSGDSADTSNAAEAARQERHESSSAASSSGVSESGQLVDWKARFPQLRVAIEGAIQLLGGRVVPKLNWSAPTDALWISATNALACRNADEIVLLLKSSDRVSHDVELLEAAAAAWGSGPQQGQEEATGRSKDEAGPAPEPNSANISAAGGCSVGSAALAEGQGGNSTWDERSTAGAQPRQDPDLRQQATAGERTTSSSAPASSCPLQPVLVLKKWQQLRPEREFRCFVRDERLVAASQRDISQAFPALTPDVVADVRRRIWRFWQERMGSGSRLGLHTCALDLYVPFDSPSWQSVRLVDLNPLMDTTSPLLYDWAELGFGPAAVPAATDLVARLRTTASTAPQADRDIGDGPVDESWMAEAVGATALPFPESADQLQVRIVEPGNYAGATGGGSVGSLSLAGLTGPMLLGSRAALAMPYDMLGIADSVDKMIEVMSRQRDPEAEGSTDDQSEPEEPQEGQQVQAANEFGAALDADEVVAPEDLAAAFGASRDDPAMAALLGDRDALELVDLISGLNGCGPEV